MIPTLITFTRGTTAINRFGRTPILPRPGVPISYKFMQKAHYVIADPDDELAGVRIDHPAVDPLPAAQDPCGFGGNHAEERSHHQRRRDRQYAVIPACFECKSGRH
jgi:hypothetical protein